MEVVWKTTISMILQATFVSRSSRWGIIEVVNLIEILKNGGGIRIHHETVPHFPQR